MVLDIVTLCLGKIGIRLDSLLSTRRNKIIVCVSSHKQEVNLIQLGHLTKFYVKKENYRVLSDLSLSRCKCA